MKDIFEKLLDFFSGGFFNIIGATVRAPFSQTKFKDLVEENLSNSIGMLVMTIVLFAVFAYFYYFI